MKTTTKISTVLISAVVAALTALALLACQTLPEYKAGNMTVSFAGAHARGSITFYPKPLVEAKYKDLDLNPFIAPPFRFMDVRSIVFRVELTTLSGPVQLQPGRMEMNFAGKTDRPINVFHLENFWKQEDVRPGDLVWAIKAADRDLMPDKWKVDGTGTTMLMYMGSYPARGKMTIAIPVYSVAGELLETLSVEFEFKS